MKPEVARRLVQAAFLRDPPTSRERWALRRLERAVHKQDRVALTAVWQQWLDRPSPALWAFLSVWGRGPLEWDAYETSGLRDLALRRLPDPGDRRFGPVVVAALGKRGHPVARITAELILSAPADAVEAVCVAASARSRP
jgi:hypothetical protein